MKKRAFFDENAEKELSVFPRKVQARFSALIHILETDGFLCEPFAKKLKENLFELRVKSEGQWRACYAYVKNNEVVILSAFQKKRQTTPQKEINKALQRLKHYER